MKRFLRKFILCWCVECGQDWQAPIGAASSCPRCGLPRQHDNLEGGGAAALAAIDRGDAA